ncbi:MAG TPA: hypothetical protein VK674_06060 [Candidatus Limnocylindria bacterium]|nr:hypothetical protein [Candidatus Limnocylindria bacterium]
MKNTTRAAIRLSITSDVRKALDMAKKRYPALSDPEILKLGLSKIVTEYDEAATLAEDRKEIRLGASAAMGEGYLKDSEEDIYNTNVGKNVHFS